MTEPPVLAVDGVGVAFWGEDHPRRRLLRDPQRRVHRAHRLERGGQDHPPADHPRPPATRLGRGPGARGTTATHRRSLGYVPQKVVLDPDVPMRARDLVALGLDGHRFGFGRRSKQQRELVDEILHDVDAEQVRRQPGRKPLRGRAAAGADRPRAGQSAPTAPPRRAAGQSRPEERPGDRRPAPPGGHAITRWRSSSRRTR